MRRMLQSIACLALAAMASAHALAAGTTASDAPAGEYTLDRSHASLTFRVNHLGFSHYTARFTRFEAKLHFEPADPAGMSLSASVDPTSIETDFPFDTIDFDAELAGPHWLDAKQFPQMTFQSARIDLSGASAATVTGNFRLHGVTRPLMLNVVFNGGYAGHPMDPAGSRIGFSATGLLRRSEFGIGLGIPEPGTTMGVSDEVEIVIEAEFTRPKP